MKINFGDAFERVIWTVIQTFSGVVVTAGTAGLAGFDWQHALIAALIAGVICIAKIFGVTLTPTKQSDENTTQPNANSVPTDYPSPPSPVE